MPTLEGRRSANVSAKSNASSVATVTATRASPAELSHDGTLRTSPGIGIISRIRLDSEIVTENASSGFSEDPASMVRLLTDSPMPPATHLRRSQPQC